MNAIEKILVKLEERCSMKITAPASNKDISKIENNYPEVNNLMGELYKVSDGIEINVPGTIFYSIKEVLDNNENNDGSFVKVGVMSFGDEIVVTKYGYLEQIDHETGETFLKWESITEYLKDELDSIV